MSKQHRQSGQSPTPSTTRLLVWGKLNKEPDWDRFAAALVAYVLRQMDEDETVSKETDDD